MLVSHRSLSKHSAILTFALCCQTEGIQRQLRHSTGSQTSLCTCELFLVLLLYSVLYFLLEEVSLRHQYLPYKDSLCCQLIGRYHLRLLLLFSYLYITSVENISVTMISYICTNQVYYISTNSKLVIFMYMFQNLFTNASVLCLLNIKQHEYEEMV